MKNKRLIEKLKRLPLNAEVRFLEDGSRLFDLDLRDYKNGETTEKCIFLKSAVGANCRKVECWDD